MRPLCPLSELPDGDCRGFDVDAQALFAVRRGDQVYVYRNLCPHRGIRLEWQEHQFLDYERQYIQCATHGALFTIDGGECIAGPCPGERLEAVPCRVEGEQVLIAL
jgi:nitrite reductase/ring-hydroxylating ferredoxin subunit